MAQTTTLTADASDAAQHRYCRRTRRVRDGRYFSADPARDPCRSMPGSRFFRLRQVDNVIGILKYDQKSRGISLALSACASALTRAATSAFSWRRCCTRFSGPAAPVVSSCSTARGREINRPDAFGAGEQGGWYDVSDMKDAAPRRSRHYASHCGAEQPVRRIA